MLIPEPSNDQIETFTVQTQHKTLLQHSKSHYKRQNQQHPSKCLHPHSCHSLQPGQNLHIRYSLSVIKTCGKDYQKKLHMMNCEIQITSIASANRGTEFKIPPAFPQIKLLQCPAPDIHSEPWPCCLLQICSPVL